MQPSVPDSEVTEAFVAWVWEARRLGAVLTTLDDRRLQIIYPGRHWGSWGPDFRGALLALDGVVVRGDVEVHRRPADWVAHGHSSDPAYDGVVLHVVWAVPTAVLGTELGPPHLAGSRAHRAQTEAAAESQSSATLTADPGMPAGLEATTGATRSLAPKAPGTAWPAWPALPTVALGEHLQEPLSVLLAEWQRQKHQRIEFPACQPAPEAARLLDAAGRARLEAKAARFEGDLSRVPPLETLLGGILETLGYSANAAPFRRLVERFPLDQALAVGTVKGEDYLTALLLGEAALLPAQAGQAVPAPSLGLSSSGRAPPPLPELGPASQIGLAASNHGSRPDDYPQGIGELWRESGRSGPATSLGWRWVGVRPTNAPHRRVAAAAALLASPTASLVAEQVMRAVLELPPRRVGAALRRLLIRRGHPYWREHSDFGRLLPRPAAVLGSQRAADAVVNAVLPWTVAMGRQSGNALLIEAALAAYAAHPLLADNQITRHMARQLIGPDASRVVRGAAHQQGLIHLYQHWCDARACAACPAGRAVPAAILGRAGPAAVLGMELAIPRLAGSRDADRTEQR